MGARTQTAAVAVVAASFCAVAMVTFAGARTTNDAQPAAAEFFSTTVKPLLSNRCFKCHGPDDETRQAGLRFDDRNSATEPRNGGRAAIVPSDADAGEIMARLTSTDPDVVMPPPETGDPLSANEIDAIRRWIDDGAVWSRHWSLVPPVRIAPPATADDAWPRSDIDRYVLARLESEGLEPSAEADRHTLIRRVSLDLTGLPPTPDDVEAFVQDLAPGAYERVVDRLLASPAFGERWASVWLDQVRYADTRGYEKDAHRVIWPYRDWVIKAINDDMPFDQFTMEQIAGDLIPNATPDQQLATAMHRNTMTNDEGGTDDEEFRVAAVMDRVETTMQVWMGLTATCARCHTHKYDPITQREYYELYAFFNQTEDADRTDEAPTMAVVDADAAAPLADLEQQRSVAESAIESKLDELMATPPADQASDDGLTVWIDDRIPFGAAQHRSISPSIWDWRTADDRPVLAGRRAVWNEGAGMTQSYITDAPAPLRIGEGDVLIAHAYISPDAPTRELMLQFFSARAGWSHRAYWGENLVHFGADDTPERRRFGDLPPAGQWARLEVSAAMVGLQPGDEITGWAFTQFDGRVGWDQAGVISTAAQHDLSTQSSWEAFIREHDVAAVPAPITEAVRRGESGDDIRRYYLQHVSEAAWPHLASLAAELEEIDASIASLRMSAPRVPIMRELAPDMQRETRLLEKGSFLSPGSIVEPGTPGVLHAFPTDASPTRAGLAAWLTSRDSPLTARVAVNRTWSRLFGQGIVATEEDFGSQGALPSHPALLDHLAVSFMDEGWSFKALCREIVTSSTYRQASSPSPELLERDPNNVLLARGPRFRLSAEMVRDQALALSGLLSSKMYGPSVYPSQPDGVWQVVYSGEAWRESEGEDRRRRALYTYLRRTSPYPSMLMFDAPSREVCEPRRIRTNTPLQALVTLNDPVFVEAAQALARRCAAEGGSAHEIARRMLELCLSRPADDAEASRLAWLYFDELAHYSASPDQARAMATQPLGPVEGDVAQLAAWTVVANVVLNLDELLTRP